MPLWHGPILWNSQFLTCLTFPDHQGSCNPSNISWTIWLLYCDQLCLHLLYNKCFLIFGCFYGIIAQSKLVKHKFLNQTTLHIHLWGFWITHREKQCTSEPVSQLPWYHHPQWLPSMAWTTSITYYMYCKLQTKIYQNIAKLLTHPRTSFIFWILFFFPIILFLVHYLPILFPPYKNFYYFHLIFSSGQIYSYFYSFTIFFYKHQTGKNKKGKKEEKKKRRWREEWKLL